MLLVSSVAIITVNLCPSDSHYKFHPVLLDACLHFVLHPDIAQPPNKETLFLPSRLRRFTFYSSPPRNEPIFSHVKMIDWSPRTLSQHAYWYFKLLYDQNPECTISAFMTVEEVASARCTVWSCEKSLPQCRSQSIGHLSSCISLWRSILPFARWTKPLSHTTTTQ